MLNYTVRVIPMGILTQAGGLTELRHKAKLASGHIVCRTGATDLATEKKLALRFGSRLGRMFCKVFHPNGTVI